MAYRRTGSMHRMGDALLTQIESDLVERPEGRVTYKEIFEHYGLKAKGISKSAFARYAQYVEATHRIRSVRWFSDRLTSVQGLDQKNIGLLKARAFELLMDPEAKPGDILNIIIADKTAEQTSMKREEWEIKKKQLAAAVEKSRSEEDPMKARANLEESIQAIYGITLPANK